MMVAPDKAAEAAVRGKHPTISSFFSSGLARLRRAKPEEKKEKDLGRVTPGGAPLARGYNYVVALRLLQGSPRSHKRRNTSCKFKAQPVYYRRLAHSALARQRSAPVSSHL
jgi:hypothetical protein